MTNFKPNDNLEYIRALTGPTLVKDEEEQPRLPTLILGDGLKLTTNLALRTHRLDVEGGGSPDRIESPSGEAFVESTDDSPYGGPASIMRAEAGGFSARVRAHSVFYGSGESELRMWVGPDSNPFGGGAGFIAHCYGESDRTYGLSAYGAPLAIEEPTSFDHAATKGYVDSITGLNSTIAEGELTLTWDSENAYGENVTLAEAGPLRYTRIGRTVTLSGNLMLLAESDGAATAVFTGIAGAALPDTSLVWRGGTAFSPLSHALKPTQIYMSHVVPQIEFTVMGAAAEVYRTNFVISYKSAE